MIWWRRTCNSACDDSREKKRDDDDDNDDALPNTRDAHAYFKREHFLPRIGPRGPLSYLVVSRPADVRLRDYRHVPI